MVINSKKMVFIIILDLLISFFFPILVTNQNNIQNHYFITYHSNFFSLFLKNETYYGSEDYQMFIDINIYYSLNDVENISFKLELLSKKEQMEDYIFENKYFYNINERIIYKNETQIGIIPIFIEENLTNNQEILLADFNNVSLTGIHKEEESTLPLSERNIPYHYVEVDTSEGNYTMYYYSDFENMLIWWEIGNKYDVTLDYIFEINYFFGDIKLKDTNYDLHWTENLDKNAISLISTIIIISVFSIVFITLFLFVRRRLKSNDEMTRVKKKNIKKRNKKKSKYEKW